MITQTTNVAAGARFLVRKIITKESRKTQTIHKGSFNKIARNSPIIIRVIVIIVEEVLIFIGKWGRDNFYLC